MNSSTSLSSGDSSSGNDPVNHPKHYTSHPSGIECIQVTEHMNFCLGSATKYIEKKLAGLKEKGGLIDEEVKIGVLAQLVDDILLAYSKNPDFKYLSD